MINNVTLIGRLTRDVEQKQGKSGNSYAYITLAVNRNKKDEEADFIDCVVLGKQVELLCKYTRKGSLLAIQGTLQSNKDKDGNKYLNVLIREVQFLDGNKSKDIQPQPKQEAPQPLEQVSYAQPTYQTQQQPMQQQAPVQQNPGWVPQQEQPQYVQPNLNDNDLPFI